jgi:hypothetical protein
MTYQDSNQAPIPPFIRLRMALFKAGNAKFLQTIEITWFEYQLLRSKGM